VRSVAQSAMERATVPDSERGTRFRGNSRTRRLRRLDERSLRVIGGGKTGGKQSLRGGSVQGRRTYLLLDEPTNHLDLAGIEWLETLIRSRAIRCVVVITIDTSLKTSPATMAE